MCSQNVGRGLMVCFIVILSLTLVGWVDVSSSQQASPITVSVATAVVESDATGQGAIRFCELLKQKTNGRLKVQFFPASQLGGDREMIEQVKLGTIDFFVGVTAPQTGFVPDMRMFDLPYLFADREKAAKILDGDLGKKILAKWEPQGVKGLAWSDNGYRQMLTKNKAIRTPGDLVGMRIRIMEAPVYKALFDALGASPVPVPWTELYTALQTNLVDGCEIPIVAIGTTKLYKVAPYVSKTSHVLTTTNYLSSIRKFNSWPVDVQTAVIEAAKEAGVYARQVVTQVEKKWYEDIAADGGKITEADVDLFRNKTKVMAETYGKQINEELYKEIRKAQGGM